MGDNATFGAAFANSLSQGVEKAMLVKASQTQHKQTTMQAMLLKEMSTNPGAFVNPDPATEKFIQSAYGDKETAAAFIGMAGRAAEARDLAPQVEKALALVKQYEQQTKGLPPGQSINVKPPGSGVSFRFAGAPVPTGPESVVAQSLGHDPRYSRTPEQAQAELDATGRQAGAVAGERAIGKAVGEHNAPMSTATAGRYGFAPGTSPKEASRPYAGIKPPPGAPPGAVEKAFSPEYEQPLGSSVASVHYGAPRPGGEIPSEMSGTQFFVPMNDQGQRIQVSEKVKEGQEVAAAILTQALPDLMQITPLVTPDATGQSQAQRIATVYKRKGTSIIERQAKVKNITIFESNKKLIQSLVTRLSGQVGVLTERDVQYIQDTMPDSSTPTDTAMEQWHNLAKFMFSKVNASRSLNGLALINPKALGYRGFSTGAAPAEASPTPANAPAVQPTPSLGVGHSIDFGNGVSIKRVK